ncbi:bifunctional 4-hydroxy-2-oxoglutarate aldolase/2-dehydro-3-deoxy-phosphogluconate aldolase [Nocardioides mangrovi]|uniref:Bifunctional 4-hydroxy-2-oxoglutarate aldolase/2-dehydro-3-deoxy-phosphogluconate aldolase n=1 Tax=Nocardioides mangrovi TaxID=2874580 RepID=A0ABS7UIV4_9ACTN|nr:bifunctional 4-hydroxy-2-oxoglutarate aldolase/2-dehydro-3-deoxy-phosphogluconate aldolase [Nocardioides mangrovi]MBZ5740973.1 bifunctional 4-hydroxy-2-oxoglutarate aldolase/2-dehydro-3-deoxy-phosphogluconate aldolase [Nocardioides mangrovi]
MTLLDVLARERFLPLAVVGHAAEAPALVDEIAAAGHGLVEIALRTDAAVEAIAGVGGRTDVLVGAGTVTTTEQVDAVVDAGARFVVTPGFRADVVARCLDRGVDVLPGVATPGEVMAAVAVGLSTVKLFPAAVLGGPAMVDALAGPFPDVRVVPSGGITPDLVPVYLERPTVLAVSGSWRRP